MPDARAVRTATHSANFDRRVRLILDVLEARYREPDLQLADVARAANLSPCYSCRLLKQVTGRGFVAHLHARRVVAARDLLTQPLVSVKEVAISVGYKSVTQLDRHYRQMFGVTPSSARDRLIDLGIQLDDLHTNDAHREQSQDLMTNRKN